MAARKPPLTEAQLKEYAKNLKPGEYKNIPEYQFLIQKKRKPIKSGLDLPVHRRSKVIRSPRLKD
jgi:hypothetical protein